MNPLPFELEYTNCCQPWQLGDGGVGGGGVQLAVLNRLVLSCSEKIFVPPISLIVLVTLSKIPTAVSIEPVTTLARPPGPTMSGRIAGG